MGRQGRRSPVSFAVCRPSLSPGYCEFLLCQIALRFSGAKIFFSGFW